MIIGLLAGTLGGAAMGRDVIDFNHDDDSVTNTGQAIAAINIAAFGDVAIFKRSVDALVRDFRNSQRMPASTASGCPANAAMKRASGGRSLGIPWRPRCCADWTRSPTSWECRGW
jgi:LDH2 family malate/lactate/ureidoglycolate dehydrogenase